MFNFKIDDEVSVNARGKIVAMEKRYDGKIVYRIQAGTGNLLFCLESELIPVDKDLEKALKEIV